MAKSSPKQNQVDIANFIPSIFIIGFLCVGFIPNWEAVDKIAPQLAANFRAEEKTAVLPPALLKDSGEHRALQFYARVHDLLESDFICPGGRFCHKNCHQDVRREFANALSIGKQNF